MARVRRLLGAICCGCVAVANSASAQKSDPDVQAVQAVVRTFHEALSRGDEQAVRALLAPDAVILESGHVESRQEYLSHHLSADIEFAKAVPSIVTHSEGTVAGVTAWVHSTAVSRGKFRDRTISLAGAELVVLSRSPSGWKIRAIHWSSHESK